ncbi:MAG: SIMPL domain-containing protein [Acidimicrobiales bacterium]
MRPSRPRWMATGVGVLAAAAVAAGLVAWPGGGSAGADPTATGCGHGAPTLTVRGTGTATGAPDLLTIDLAVGVVGQDAHGALASDDAATSAVLAALTSAGVARHDVQTTGLSLQPDYAPDGTLTGYAVSNRVVASLRHLATAGAVVDAAVGAGGDAARIDSLSFSLARPSTIEDQARHAAVRRAASHAGAMAAAAGEHLGSVCSVTDKTGSSPPPQTLYAPAAGRSAAANVPLAPGTQTASAQVAVVYALVPGTAPHG